SNYAPALAEGHAFDMDPLLEFDNYETRKLPVVNKIAPGCITTHGHRGGIRLNSIAGRAAGDAATTLDASVIIGHTHRPGTSGDSVGYAGKSRVLTGMEVGDLMDMKKAQYLKGGSANWQQGFGIVHIEGTHVQATPVLISGKKFTVDGVTYNV